MRSFLSKLSARPVNKTMPGGGHGGVLLTIHRLSQGGADRVAMLIANGFAATGRPTRIAILRDGGEGTSVMRSLLRDDVELRFAGAPMGSRHLELVRGLRSVMGQVASMRPSLVIASSSNVGLVTGLCQRLRREPGTRYVMKLTNPVIRPRDRSALHRFYRRRLYDFVFGSYDLVLTLSEAEQASLRRMFPHHQARFKTVANPYVTQEMLRPAARNGASERECGPEAPNILTLARMMPQKRLDTLLHAFAEMENKNAVLTIVGDGPQRAMLEKLTAKLGISCRVTMPGFKADVLPWLRRADLLVLSSEYEGLPAVVLEALACNVPVVTTDCFEAAGSLLMGAACCAVVPIGDVRALAKAMDKSLNATNQPIDLRPLSLPYVVETAIAAHVAVMT